jgi:hypothetical protein
MLMLMLTLAATPARAHHGVATVGVAGLEGPGAPLETSNSQTLPRHHWLGYVKVDDARFDTFTPQRDDETDRQTYLMFGLGYGLKPWLSLYAFLPYHAKTVQDNSYNTSGFADMSWMAVLGLKWEGGPRLVPERESLDELEDLHFTVYGGTTLPTGEPNLRDAEGVIDPGRSLGFGKPAAGLGATATLTVGPRVTAVAEVSSITFREYEYADGQRGRFGSEFRVNAAVAARVWTRPAAKLRCDLSAELHHLNLGRDETDGVGEAATGGRILYTTLGLRLYKESVSWALGWKTPIDTDLNESDLQQGAEGKESGRLLATMTCLF